MKLPAHWRPTRRQRLRHRLGKLNRGFQRRWRRACSMPLAGPWTLPATVRRYPSRRSSWATSRRAAASTAMLCGSASSSPYRRRQTGDPGRLSCLLCRRRRDPHERIVDMARARGSTLVEAIVSIVIIGTWCDRRRLHRAPIQGYADSVARAEAGDEADLALRRMTREIRLASPNSARGNADGSAIEFRSPKSAAATSPPRTKRTRRTARR